MAFEAQWVLCRQADLPVPGLPAAWSGLTVLHLSDVHAGLFPTNERSLRKVVDWAGPLAPDLVFLTGDILGDPGAAGAASSSSPGCAPARHVRRHRQPRVRPGQGPWPVPATPRTLGRGRASPCSIRLRCRALPRPGDGRRRYALVLCGADHLTGGFGLLDPRTRRPAPALAQSRPPTGPRCASDAFPILLIHEPPPRTPPWPALPAGLRRPHSRRATARARPSGPQPSERGGEVPAGVYRLGRGPVSGLAGRGHQLPALPPAHQAGGDPWRLV